MHFSCLKMTTVFTEQKIINLNMGEFLFSFIHMPMHWCSFYILSTSFDCETRIFYSEREVTGNGTVINLDVAVLFYFSFVNIYILFNGGKLVMCFQSLSVDPLRGMVDLVALFHIWCLLFFLFLAIVSNEL